MARIVIVIILFNLASKVFKIVHMLNKIFAKMESAEAILKHIYAYKKLTREIRHLTWGKLVDISFIFRNIKELQI